MTSTELDQNQIRADDIGDVFISFGTYTDHSSLKVEGEDEIKGKPHSVYVGETIRYDVVLRRRADMDSVKWKKQISRICSHPTIKPLVNKNHPSENSTKEPNMEKPDGFECPIYATFAGNYFSMLSEKDAASKPQFFNDDTFLIPLSSSLEEIPTKCCHVELRVVLWLYMINHVSTDSATESDLSIVKDIHDGNWVESENEECESESDESQDLFETFQSKEEDVVISSKLETESQACVSIGLESPVKMSSSSHSVQEKSVTQILHLQGPPCLCVRHASVGCKQLILLAVTNTTERQLVIKNIQMLSSSTPVHDLRAAYEDGALMKWESCHQLISLDHPKKHQLFPAILCPREEVHLIYRLHLSSVPSDSVSR